jgi:chitin synthase
MLNFLIWHSSTLSLNNVSTSIRGEVFDLTSVAETHRRVVGVVPVKSILKYGGQSSDDILPVQVCAKSLSYYRAVKLIC